MAAEVQDCMSSAVPTVHVLSAKGRGLKIRLIVALGHGSIIVIVKSELARIFV